MKPEKSLPQSNAVLVVEDDRRWAEIICAVGRLYGKDMEAVESLGAAMASLGKRPVGVLLLDLRLPDSTVECSLKAIWRLKERGASRVAIVTGTTVTDELRAMATECGADAVMEKDVKGFEAALEEALGHGNT